MVELTLSFYKRNYIEGLFLSSGIIRSADYTMELVIRVAKLLREEHHFRGYIHLKTIPEASPELIAEAGKYADRLSINVELPKQESLKKLAPEKNVQRTREAMSTINARITETKADRKELRKRRSTAKKPIFATGQSTQMIVGADGSNDSDFLARAGDLYGNFKLNRVYYSAFSPIPEPSVILPLQAPPLVREHRLYQADWLMRFYHYGVDELTTADAPNLDLDIDPKLSWALRNRHTFPIDINRAPLEMLYRIPGLGVRNAKRIVRLRRHHGVSLEDLIKLRVNLKKTMPFMICVNHHPARLELSSSDLRAKFAPPPKQMEMDFSAAPIVPAAEKNMVKQAGAEALHGEF